MNNDGILRILGIVWNDGLDVGIKFLNNFQNFICNGNFIIL